MSFVCKTRIRPLEKDSRAINLEVKLTRSWLMDWYEYKFDHRHVGEIAIRHHCTFFKTVSRSFFRHLIFLPKFPFTKEMEVIRS